LKEKDSESTCVQFIKVFIAALDTHQPMRELSKKEKKDFSKTVANNRFTEID
jgi:hypothetical protein